MLSRTLFEETVTDVILPVIGMYHVSCMDILMYHVAITTEF
jgi:hypothetical protein